MRHEYRSRPLTPDDSAAISRVLEATLVAGRPLPFPVMDLPLLLEYFTEFYVTCEPEAGLIVEDEAQRVVGYGLGTTQVTEQSRWQRQAAGRLLWHWLRNWSSYDPFTRWFYRLRLLDARETIVHPDPPLEAHFHWHLLPEVRGRWGRTILWHFRDHAAARGVRRFGGTVPQIESRRDPAMWSRLGGEVVHRVPHHTLTALLGEPVSRLTVASDVDAFHW